MEIIAYILFWIGIVESGIFITAMVMFRPKQSKNWPIVFPFMMFAGSALAKFLSM